jgi:hypothetical protein
MDPNAAAAADMHNNMGGMMHFDSPFTATLHQLLSEANDFIGGSPSRQHGAGQMDFHMGEAENGHGNGNVTSVGMDFGSLLGGGGGGDLVMPSSPPLLRGGRGGNGSGNGNGNGGGEPFGGVLQDGGVMWGGHMRS